MTRIYVIALNRQRFTYWLDEQAPIDRPDYSYVHSIENIRGLRLTRDNVLWLPGAELRPDYWTLFEHVEMMQRIYTAPVPAPAVKPTPFLCRLGLHKLVRRVHPANWRTCWRCRHTVIDRVSA